MLDDETLLDQTVMNWWSTVGWTWPATGPPVWISWRSWVPWSWQLWSKATCENSMYQVYIRIMNLPPCPLSNYLIWYDLTYLFFFSIKISLYICIFFSLSLSLSRSFVLWFFIYVDQNQCYRIYTLSVWAMSPVVRFWSPAATTALSAPRFLDRLGGCRCGWCLPAMLWQQLHGGIVGYIELDRWDQMPVSFL